MAQKIEVSLVDDLDGGEATQTVSFGLDGVDMEIDLSDVNALEIRRMIGGYAEHARKVGRGGRARRGAGPRPSSTGGEARSAAERESSKEKREWARAAGFIVSDRGRLPHEAELAWQNRNRVPQAAFTAPAPGAAEGNGEAPYNPPKAAGRAAGTRAGTGKGRATAGAGGRRGPRS